jgi:CHAT domain-containing protein
VGAGGLASVFIELGAGAVVAPLWSVKDTIAHEIALKFYTEAKANGSAPLAGILQRLRAKAYDATIAEDTYAAYCFYGDPLATPA